MYTAYQDYCKYIEESNQCGVLRRELTTPHVSERKNADGKRLHDGQLLRAMEEHAGYIVGGKDP